MSTRSTRSNTPLSGIALVLWIGGAALSFYLLFILISILFKYLPEPIGSRADDFASAAGMTLRLTVWSGVIGLVLGIAAGMAKISGNIALRSIASFYVWIIRGTPLYVQVLFAYYALPQLLGYLGIKVLPDEFQSGVIALSLNVGAYNAEVMRAGIMAVSKGQTEAARSLGLSGTQAMLQVILPQAIRIVIPPLINNVVGLLKDTSLVASIALLELALLGNRITSETALPIPVLTTVALVYLLLTTVLTFFTTILEKRLDTSSR